MSALRHSLPVFAALSLAAGQARPAPLAAQVPPVPPVPQAPPAPPAPSASRPVPAAVGDTSVFRPLALPAPNAIRTGTGAPGPLYWQQRADYIIQATLDTATHTVSGTETIRYTNHSPDTLHYLWIQLDQNIQAPTSRTAILAPQTLRPPEPGFTGGYTIERVDVMRRGPGPARSAPLTRTPLARRINDTMMRVDLDRPLAPHTSVSLEIAWRSQVPRQGRTGRERFPEGWLYEIAEWYPRMAVYDDVRGWNTEQYLGSGEFYLGYGDFDYAITAPAGYTVTGSGTLVNPAEVLTPTQRQRLAVALRSDTTIHIISRQEVGTPAARPAGTGATRTWRFRAQNVRDVAWAAAPNFIWDASGWEGILIQALYPPVADSLWRGAAEMGRVAIREFSTRWYHYPYPTAINVNGPVGGMEYPMIVFCANRTNERGLFSVTAHELGHEWFPMIVGSNERLYGWQDEGFNNFIDRFPILARYPQDTAANRSFGVGDAESWARYVRQLATGGVSEVPIIVPQDRSLPQVSSSMHYGKTAVGLTFLRNEVVDSNAFDDAFRTYIRRWAFKHPTPADFFRTMNDALGEDLSWFWRSWFYRTDHLDQAVDSVVQRDTSGVVLARVFLSNRAEMVAPVELRLTLADGTAQVLKLPVEAWYRSGSAYMLQRRLPQRLVRVEIDRRNAYPDVNRGNNVWPAGP